MVRSYNANYDKYGNELNVGNKLQFNSTGWCPSTLSAWTKTAYFDYSGADGGICNKDGRLTIYLDGWFYFDEGAKCAVGYDTNGVVWLPSGVGLK